MGRGLVSFPQGKTTTVLAPTAGEGDLLLPCREIPLTWLYGVEISANRTAVAHASLPQAELVTCAFEGTSIPKGSMSLVLANPPYFFQDGKRAEYRIIADAGSLLVPGGVLVAIIPARSAWDGTMINHWCRWYGRVRVWKFPDRTSPEEESTFEDYTQICVVGIRRAEPRDPVPAENRRLQGYRYHTPSASSSSGKSASRIRAGWEQVTPPPELPDLPFPIRIPCRRAWRTRTSWYGTPTSRCCLRPLNVLALTCLPHGRRPPSGAKRVCGCLRSCLSLVKRMSLLRY